MISPTHIRILLLAPIFFCLGNLSTGYAQGEYEGIPLLHGFFLHGYGVMNYYSFKWETDPERRNSIDIERLVLYPSAKLSNNITAKAEIEFEHGGTGSTIEFDRFEEFGEFEFEVEKGGEVVLDQLHIQIEFSRLANLRIGRIKLPIGMLAYEHEPGEYFTTTRSEMETSIIPSIWYENGIEFYGSTTSSDLLQFHLLVVNGLDATGFSSATWVARGHQTRFEFVNAEDLAFVAAVSSNPGSGIELGGSVYFGNSSNNRPKPDLNVNANVAVYEAHATWTTGDFQIRGMGLLGTLSHSDLVSAANRNLSNNLNVKRSPVGSQALGYFVEGGVSILRALHLSEVEMIPFVRWEFYDTMHKVTGTVFDNPRWERKVLTVGINYKPIEDLVFKAQYSRRALGLESLNHESTISAGIGFEFK